MKKKQLTGRILMALTVMGGAMAFIPSPAGAANSVTVTDKNVAAYNALGTIDATVVEGKTSYTDNTITIADPSNTAITAMIAGATNTQGKVSGNTVVLNNGTIGSSSSTQFLTGGVAVGTSADSSSVADMADHNKVVINGGTVNSNLYIYGGVSQAAPGESGIATAGNVDANAVAISGGAFNGREKLVGGITEALSMNSDAALTTGDATNNTLTITGGTFIATPEFMVGGLSIAGTPGFPDMDNASGEYLAKSATAGNASGNTVDIKGANFFYKYSLDNGSHVFGGGGSVAVAGSDATSTAPVTRTARSGDVTNNNISIYLDSTSKSRFSGNNVMSIVGGMSLATAHVAGPVTGTSSVATAEAGAATGNSIALTGVNNNGKYSFILGGGSSAMAVMPKGSGQLSATAGNANDNAVTLSNVTLSGNYAILGGGVSLGVAQMNNNTSAGTAAGRSGDASHNKITGDGVTVGTSLFVAAALGGGSAALGMAQIGDTSGKTGNVEGNSLILTNGSLNSLAGSVLAGGLNVGAAYTKQDGSATSVTGAVTNNTVSLTKEKVGQYSMIGLVLGGGNISAAGGYSKTGDYNTAASASAGAMSGNTINVVDTTVTGTQLAALGGGLEVVAALGRGTGNSSATASGDVMNNAVTVASSDIHANLSSSFLPHIPGDGSLILGGAQVGAAIASDSGTATSAMNSSVRNNTLTVSDTTLDAKISTTVAAPLGFSLTIAGALGGGDISLAAAGSGGAVASAGSVSNNNITYTNTDIGKSATISTAVAGLNVAGAYNGKIGTVLPNATAGDVMATAGGVNDNNVTMSGGSISGTRLAALGGGLDVAAAISTLGGSATATVNGGVSGNSVTASDVTIESTLTNPQIASIRLNGAVLLGGGQAAVSSALKGSRAVATTNGAVSHNVVSLEKTTISTAKAGTSGYSSGVNAVAGADIVSAMAGAKGGTAVATGNTVSGNALSLLDSTINNANNAATMLGGGLSLVTSYGSSSAVTTGAVSDNSISVTGESKVNAAKGVALAGGLGVGFAYAETEGTTTVHAGDITNNTVKLEGDVLGQDTTVGIVLGGGALELAGGYTPFVDTVRNLIPTGILGNMLSKYTPDKDTGATTSSSATVGSMVGNVVQATGTTVAGERLAGLAGGVEVVAAVGTGSGTASVTADKDVRNNAVTLASSKIQTQLSDTGTLDIPFNGSTLQGATRIGLAIADGSGTAVSSMGGVVSDNAVNVSDSAISLGIDSGIESASDLRLTISGVWAAANAGVAVAGSGGATAATGLVDHNSITYANTTIGDKATISAAVAGLNVAAAYNGKMKYMLSDAQAGTTIATAGGMNDNSVTVTGGSISASRLAALGAGLDVAAAVSTLGGDVSATVDDGVSGNHVTASNVELMSTLLNPTVSTVHISGVGFFGGMQIAAGISPKGQQASARTNGAVTNNSVSLTGGSLDVTKADNSAYYSAALAVAGMDDAFAMTGSNGDAVATGSAVQGNTISLSGVNVTSVADSDVMAEYNTGTALAGGISLAGSIGKNGSATSGAVSNNTIVISGESTVDANVVTIAAGGLSGAVVKSSSGGSGSAVTGDVYGNNVSFTDFAQGSYGGDAVYTAVLGGGAAAVDLGIGNNAVTTGAVHDNSVTITDGFFATGAGTTDTLIMGGMAMGWSENSNPDVAVSTGDVYNNSVHITGGNIGFGSYYTLIGGGAAYVKTRDNSTNAGSVGAVHDNNVVISGGTIYNAWQMNTVVAGGISNGTEIYHNSVTIQGGTVSGDIYGGAQYTGRNHLGSGKLFVDYPDLNIPGIVDYGVATYFDNKFTAYGNNNIINIYGGDLYDASLHGGSSTAEGGIGNTLNVYAKNLTAKTMDHFQNYNFYVPADLRSGDTMLSLTTSGTVDMSDATIAIGMNRNSYRFQTGDAINLVTVPTGTLVTNTAAPNDTLTAQQGISTAYTFGLNNKEQQLRATVLAVEASPQTKSLSEMQVAGMSLLNTGADLTADAGVKNAMQEGSQDKNGTAVFTAMSGGKLKADTGSYVDTRYFDMMVGIAKSDESQSGSIFTKGLFFETGWGSYQTFNDLSGGREVWGDGHGHYMGGGLLARVDRPSGTYLEGSFHVGHLNTTYGSDDFIGSDGERVTYDTGSTYYGAHIGIGKIKKISDVTSLDLYGKYFWSHMPSRSATILGEEFNFDSMSSNRLRLGARWLQADEDHNGQTYIGVAVEHEFSGSQDGTAAGLNMAAPSMKGTSGLVEVGWSSSLNKKHTFGTDVRLTGHFGERRGIGGALQFKWLV